MGLPNRVESVRAPDSETTLAATRRHQRRTTSRDQWRCSLPEPAAATTAIAQAAAPKRSVTIEQLLVWAYAEQRVHKYLRRERDWFLWAAEELLGDLSPDIEPQGLRAARLDPAAGGGGQGRRAVHHDAAVVHEAVMGLGEDLAHLVFYAAATGDFPERFDGGEPRPAPIEASGPDDDYGVHEWRDQDGVLQRRYYVLRTAELVVLDEQEYRLDGRKKVKQGRPRKRREDPGSESRPARRRGNRVAVQYAPIAWNPDPSYIAMCNEVAERWETALAALGTALAGAGLRAHVLMSSR